MEKVLFDPMIDIFCSDYTYGDRQITIIFADAMIKDYFIDKRFKVNIEKFKQILSHHFDALIAMQDYAKEKKLKSNYYIEVVFNKSHLFIPIGDCPDTTSESERQKIYGYVHNFQRTICHDLLSLCRYNKIELQDLQNAIEDKVAKMDNNTEFSFEQLFDEYERYIDSQGQKELIKHNILQKNPHKIKPIDEENDKYMKIIEENMPWNFDFFEDDEKNKN